jgi:hypothetical protein
MLQNSVPLAETEQTPAFTPNVNRVGIRVPLFWSEKPAVRFAKLEGQFALSGITKDLRRLDLIRIYDPVEKSKE